jgi:hypothetical protein
MRVFAVFGIAAMALFRVEARPKQATWKRRMNKASQFFCQRFFHKTPEKPGFFRFWGQHLVNTAGIIKRGAAMQNQDPDDPIVWLLLLERGRQTCDFELAARARRELSRLGITVTYKKPRKRRQPAEGVAGNE